MEGSKEYPGNRGNEIVGHLYISALKPSHQGNYTCLTKNIVGSDEKNIFVTVVGMLVGIRICVSIMLHDLHTHIRMYVRTYQYNILLCITNE